MRPISNRFTTFHLDDHEDKLARSITPYFYAFLQNKIAAYATAVIEVSYEGKTEGELQTAILEHERLKAQVIVLEELMQELTPPTVAEEDPNSIG